MRVSHLSTLSEMRLQPMHFLACSHGQKIRYSDVETIHLNNPQTKSFNTSPSYESAASASKAIQQAGTWKGMMLTSISGTGLSVTLSESESMFQSVSMTLRTGKGVILTLRSRSGADLSVANCERWSMHGSTLTIL